MLRDGIRAQVILGEWQRSVVDLPSGRVTAITGIPDDHQVTSALRLRGVTVVLAGASDSEQRLRGYAIADGTTHARPLPVRGFQISPAETDRTFWAHRRIGDDSGPGRELVQERDRAGRVLRRAVLPTRHYPIRGVVGGLLVSTYHEEDATTTISVWDPDRRRIVRTVGRGGGPLAATATHVSWSDRSCPTASEACILHITDVRTGSDAVVPLPRGHFIHSGALSPDGTAIALTTVSEWSDRHVAHSFVISVDSGHVVPLAGSRVLVERDLGVHWTDAGDAVVLSTSLARGGTTLGVWRRSGTGVEVVSGDFENAIVVAVRPAG